MNWLLVFAGGGIGSLLRYGITLASKQFFLTTFPAGTLLSNVLSCLIMGLTIRYAAPPASDSLKAFVLAGICGGFSTFSSFSLENVELARGGHWLMAGANILISTLACFLLLYQLTRTTNP
ncbi:MAG: CrcB family protein [Bacteroidia bacterium]|nr:CrcB family protein [Bacteroidia bacterium]